MMAIGMSICSGPLLVGALADTLLNRFIPEHFKKTLPLIAGPISISIGIHFVNKLHNLLPIVLTITVGTTIGGLLSIEEWIEWVGTTLRAPIECIFPVQASVNTNAEDFMSRFITVLILFCVSGTGISGALTEGMTGGLTILPTKSILDFFIVVVFASTLGYIITVILIPQLIVFIILFFVAAFVMAPINLAMIADFTACGGIVTLTIDFRLCGIRAFSTAGILPSLLLVMPFSATWQQFIA